MIADVSDARAEDRRPLNNCVPVVVPSHVAGDAVVAPSTRVAVTVIWPARAVVRQEPGCWTSLKHILFGARQFWPPGPAAPKALVHEMRNAKGEQRLVAIIVAPTGGPRATGWERPKLGLVAAVAILMISFLLATESWIDVLRRDNEKEMMFRAQEIVRALQRYLAHPVSGCWHESLDAHGHWQAQDTRASSLYHIVYALETACALKPPRR